jgi:uncharacterized protein
MRWSPDGDNSNIEDRRGSSGGGGPGLKLGLGGFLLLGALSLLFRRNLFTLLGDGGAGPTTATAPRSPEEEKTADFSKFVFNDVQREWTKRLAGTPTGYPEAKLVLYTQRTTSACGTANSSVGPFYCPADTKVYLDLAFFEELSRRFRAPGDFAQAYVIAHEVGHHVQKVLGAENTFRQQQEGKSKEAKNALSVKFELQADCYAGMWAKTTSQRKLIEMGDLDEALAAASAIGDDRLQKQATGTVHPESFTHGTAAQRAFWFRRGFGSDQVERCDTTAVE